MASDSKTRLLREAEKLVLQGKIPQAIGEYLKIVSSDPDDVLVRNTVGDLHLRAGNTKDANRLFHQVAETYIRTNFLLKAVAVYKKILASDPSNLELHATIASLCARQGMNVDARHQYLHIADMYARQNKTRECAEALEKVVELDPMNSAVQLRLAEIYVREGNSQQARQHLNGAGRALAKAGDHRAAVDVYRRALDMDGRNTESLRGFLDAAQQLGDAQLVQQQLSVALEQIPDDVDVRELAGRAFLSAHDTESALRHFEFVLAADPLRYENYILVSNHLLEAGDFDGASASLDPILPIAISRREPAPLIQACDLILAQAPEHVPTLRKLAEVSSALNDGIRYLDALERQADVHARQGNAAGALECLAKILEFSPDSKEHRNMHREMFAKAYPDQPYIPPVQHDSPASLEPHTHAEGAAGAGVEEEGATNPALIEIDLLLNYGMKEKARLQLQELIGVDPYDRHARLRLFTIHKEAGESREAAEQALLLAALHERAGKEAAAGRHLAEAKKLDPDRVGARFDLASFAEQHGIAMAEVKARAHTVPAGSATALELDLSGDLTEIFFQDSAGELAIDEVESDATEAAGLTDEIGAGISKPPRPALSEQLQEVDFYIRLGFADEAKAKLSEIARDYPDHPELEPRYQKLDAGVPPSPDDRPAGSLGGLDAVRPEPVGGDDIGALWESDALSFDPQEPPVIALGAQSGEAEVQTAAAAAAESQSQVLREIGAEIGVNEMFADLIDEVNSLTDQEIVREDFETHFSLGIAYREMGLADEAIKEFQGAVKSLDPATASREAVQCCGMLSTCFLDKGMPRSAIRWCQTGLGLADISEHERMALKYDMSVALALTGENGRALEGFHEIFAIDPSYRDVAQRIDELRAGQIQHASPDHP